MEWLQITPFLAYQDYWITGQTDLTEAYDGLLYNNTQIQFIDDKTGLINTSKPISRPELFGTGPGRHIIGWDPAPAKDMFSKSDFMSVPNMFTVHGLELLSELLTKAGKSADAQKCASHAATLRKAVMSQMWNAKTNRFCDGICTDQKVNGHSGIYSDMYPLWMGLVPEEHVATVWKSLTSWGLEQIGDCEWRCFSCILLRASLHSSSAHSSSAILCDRLCLHELVRALLPASLTGKALWCTDGAFIYFHALATHPSGDTGEAALKALTKCDTYS